MDTNEKNKSNQPDQIDLNEERRILHEKDLEEASVEKVDDKNDFGSIWNNLVIRPVKTKPVESQEKFDKKLIWKNFSIQYFIKSFAEAPYRFKLLIIFLAFILLALCTFLFLSIIAFTATQNSVKLQTETQYIQSKDAIASDFAPLIPAELTIKDKQSSISGELFTTTDFEKFSNQRPYLISIDNQKDSRTQMAGLVSSDAVYEFPVEGGITRYIGVFWSKSPSLVGPVRSIRPYMMDILPEYDGILSHWGQSAIDPKYQGYKGNETAGVDSASYYTKYSVKHTECGIYEDKLLTSAGVAVEHSLFVNVSTLQSCIPAGWVAKPTIRSYLFKNDLEKDLRPIVSEADISTGTPINDIRWVYDPISNSYTRFLNSKVQQERENGEITSKTVIIQYVNATQSGDTLRHNILGMTGTNTATILMDGKVYAATWKKATRDDRTIFYDDKGAEFRFDRGRIWYQIVPEKSSFIDTNYTVDVK